MKRLKNLVKYSKINTYLCNANYKPIKNIGVRVVYLNKATNKAYIIYNNEYYSLNVATYKGKTVGKVYYPPYHNKGR